MNRESKKLEKYLSGNLIILIFIPPKKKGQFKRNICFGTKTSFYILFNASGKGYLVIIRTAHL